MTLLHIINYCFLQWFFVRLAKIRLAKSVDARMGWTLIKVWPLSGYGGRPYRYWGTKS